MNEMIARDDLPFTTLTLKDEFTEQRDSFCSMAANSPEEKANLFNATNNPAHRVADYINATINVKDVFCEIVTITNRESGEVSQCPRVVLIDDKGEGYQAVSFGVFSALKKLMQVYGVPTWEPAIPVKVQQISKGTNKMLTFSVDK